MQLHWASDASNNGQDRGGQLGCCLQRSRSSAQVPQFDIVNLGKDMQQARGRLWPAACCNSQGSWLHVQLRTAVAKVQGHCSLPGPASCAWPYSCSTCKLSYLCMTTCHTCDTPNLLDEGHAASPSSCWGHSLPSSHMHIIYGFGEPPGHRSPDPLGPT